MKNNLLFFLFLFTLVAYCQNLSDGLLINYMFDGDTNDSSGNNYNGQGYGIIYGLDRFGNANSAVYLDGLNDYIEFPNNDNLKPDLPITFSFWINYDNINYENSTVFNTSFEEDVNSGVYMNIQSSTSRYQISYGDGSTFYSSNSRRTYTSNSILQPNKWHQVVIIVKSSMDMEIYLNCLENGGSFSGSGGQLQYSTTPGNIGRHDRSLTDEADYFKGAIDDFRYWNRELTEEEVQLLFEVDYNIASSMDPTACNAQDGEIVISGLASDVSYSVMYDFDSNTENLSLVSNLDGEIVISGLSKGFYSNIVINQEGTGCSDNLGDVFLDANGLNAAVEFLNPSTCGTEDGSFTISGLSANTEYSVAYNFDSLPESVVQFSNNDGNLIVSGLASGFYENIMITEASTTCSTELGSFTLIEPNLSANISSVNPSNCLSENGRIIFRNLNINEAYFLSYDGPSGPITTTLMSDGLGTLSLDDLALGNYLNILIEEVSSGCQNNFLEVILNCEEQELSCFKVMKFFTPNNDDVNDFWSLTPLNGNVICRYTVKIFNRYGKLLKVLNNANSVWDGTYNGRKMPSSDYWYVIDYFDGTDYLQYKSHFSLKR